jgi:hypothetical protein
MNLDAATVVLRQRTPVEIVDLALVVCRRHWLAIPVLILVGALPWALLDGWLVSGGAPSADEDATWARWFPYLLLVAAQVPLATAPLTAFLGQALFDRRPSVGRALVTAWKRTPVLLGAGVLRGLFALIPPVLLAWPSHLIEALVLEGQGFAGAWRRAGALRGADTGAGPLLTLLGLPVLVGSVVLVVGTLEAVLGLLIHADPWQVEQWTSAADPGASLAIQVAVWAAVGYLGVVRFFAYIDLRTRAEGWAIDLDLRRAAARLEPGAP